MTADLFDATSGRSNDVVVVFEVLHKEMFGRCSVGLVAAVGHWLPAAGLIEWIRHAETESLQELERGDPNLRKHHVDVAGDEESNPHALPYCPLICWFGLCSHF